MSSDPKIAPQTLAGIERLSQAGRALLDSGEPARAIAELEAALKLVPEPRWVYAAAMKIYATIGDAELALGRLERARDAFGSAAGSAEAAANPYVHLRYGQVLYALGERGAVDALAKAAIAGGVTVFAIADRLDLLEVVDEKLEPPAGYGSWVEYADSSDWQEIEGTDRIAAEDENDEEGSLVDDFSSDTERVSEDQAAFWQAVDRGDVGRVRELLPRVEVNKVVPGGTMAASTALAVAAVGQHPDVVQLLVDAGADPNAPCPLCPPLHSGLGNLRAVTLLLDAGANLETTDADDRTALFSAADTGSAPGVIELLIERGANVHTSSHGITLWELARKERNRDLLKLLERAGAKPGAGETTSLGGIRARIGKWFRGGSKT